MPVCSLISHWPDQQTQKKNYERLQKALDSVMSIREMTQVRNRMRGCAGWGYIQESKGLKLFLELKFSNISIIIY